MDNTDESTLFFQDVYEFSIIERKSGCNGFTNHIQSEKNVLELTPENKYIVIFVERKKKETGISKKVIIPNKKIKISDVDYTLTGIISLRNTDHYIYYEFNHEGNVIRVYDDQRPYIDLDETNIINNEDNKLPDKKNPMDEIYIDAIKHTDHINTHGCLFLYSRYPVDQYQYKLNNQRNVKINIVDNNTVDNNIGFKPITPK
jgi:hypothetical protein